MTDSVEREKDKTIVAQPKLVVSGEEASASSDVVKHAKLAGLPAEESLIGSVLDGRYQIVGLIGTGATSAVYKAHDERMKRDVAVKVLRAHLLCDELIVSRFQQEARTAGLIDHPNVVSVHDCSLTESGLPYLVMDYVDGTSLQQILNEQGWLPHERAIRLV